MMCPYCEGVNVEPVSRLDMFDRLLGILGRRPYLCAGCNSRFFAKTAAPPAAAESRPVDIAWAPVGAKHHLFGPEDWGEFRQSDFICPPELGNHLMDLLVTGGGEETGLRLVLAHNRIGRRRPSEPKREAAG